LLLLAGSFLGFYSLALTLSNAVRLRSWQVEYRWGHWLGLLAWLAVAYMAHRQLTRWLPGRDPYLFPVVALLTGWGLLTIWRLSSLLALRQTAWLALIGMAFILALHYDYAHPTSGILTNLRRFKYVWLTCGLLLTAATIFLGSNPLGAGPRLWLGCCGVYFQPSEPLKLLLIVYLAAYLADLRVSPSSTRKLLPLLTPTLLMTGLALLLLVFQRDLGTAAIFMALYAVIVCAGTGNKKVLYASLFIVLLASVAGYALFDVVVQRVDAWVNPWLDPSGRSYQIVQSLLAVANGGILGRGPGMGSPNVVPIAQSDFIFSAITEESGLLGAIGLLGLLAVLVQRGMRAAIQAADPFHRLLAIGLVAHLVGQSILIIAGNLRLLPLTGVTLPFVSNGGSSLLVSFFELLCLLLISARQDETHVFAFETLKPQIQINLQLSRALILGLAGTALAAGWWGLVRESALLSRTDNPRRSIADSYVLRGSILDNKEQPLAHSFGQPGAIVRQYPYPALGPLVGYTDPVYGQAGLEASLDPYLRGLQGYPTLTMAWERLLYAEPPPGLDVRLSLDLELQAEADRLLNGHQGALVLLNARSGEVIAISSSPSFDANTLEANWESLINDPHAPLFNRATMGLYPPGTVLGVFLLTGSHYSASGSLDSSNLLDCTISPMGTTWAETIAAGCTAPDEQLFSSMNPEQVIKLLDGLGLYQAPVFPVETLSSSMPPTISDPSVYLTGLGADPVTGVTLKVSPLQMALAAASLSNAGVLQPARLVMGVENPQAGWVILPVDGVPQQAFQANAAIMTAQAMADHDLPIWQAVAAINIDPTPLGGVSASPAAYTWFIGGTLPNWSGVPLAMAVLLEEDNPQNAIDIGRTIFKDLLIP
jgi:cell division protein FtsW (lipid II flippase)